MSSIWTQLWDVFSAWLVALIIGTLGITATGCTFATRNNGEIGFEIGTKWVFISKSSQTAPEEAYSRTDFPAFVDWWNGTNSPPVKPIEMPPMVSPIVDPGSN